jgi:hypothetical protein
MLRIYWILDSDMATWMHELASHYLHELCTALFQVRLSVFNIKIRIEPRNIIAIDVDASRRYGA